MPNNMPNMIQDSNQESEFNNINNCNLNDMNINNVSGNGQSSVNQYNYISHQNLSNESKQNSDILSDFPNDYIMMFNDNQVNNIHNSDNKVIISNSPDKLSVS